jgi:hypothetical protein
VTSVVLGLPQYTPGKGYGQRGSAEIVVVCITGLRNTVEVADGCAIVDVRVEGSGVCEDGLTVLIKVDVIFEVIVVSFRELVVGFG